MCRRIVNRASAHDLKEKGISWRNIQKQTGISDL